jgi:hypothetical protein
MTSIDAFMQKLNNFYIYERWFQIFFSASPPRPRHYHQEAAAILFPAPSRPSPHFIHIVYRWLKVHTQEKPLTALQRAFSLSNINSIPQKRVGEAPRRRISSRLIGRRRGTDRVSRRSPSAVSMKRLALIPRFLISATVGLETQSTENANGNTKPRCTFRSSAVVMNLNHYVMCEILSSLQSCHFLILLSGC